MMTKIIERDDGRLSIVMIGLRANEEEKILSPVIRYKIYPLGTTNERMDQDLDDDMFTSFLSPSNFNIMERKYWIWTN